MADVLSTTTAGMTTAALIDTVSAAAHRYAHARELASLADNAATERGEDEAHTALHMAIEQMRAQVTKLQRSEGVTAMQDHLEETAARFRIMRGYMMACGRHRDALSEIDGWLDELLTTHAAVRT